MQVIAQFAEAIAVLIPDFQTWGLSAAMFVSLYSCAAMLGLPWASGVKPGAVLSLVFAYVFSLALNVMTFLSSTAAPRLVILPRLKSRVAQSVHEVSTRQCFRSSAGKQGPASETAPPVDRRLFQARRRSERPAATDPVPKCLP